MKKMITALMRVLFLVMTGIASVGNGILPPADEAFSIPVLLESTMIVKGLP